MVRLFSGLLLLGILGGSFAQDQGKKKSSEPVFEEGKLLKVEGNKVYVDLKKIDKGKSGKQSRNILPESKFFLEGREVQPKDLVSNLDVRIYVKGKDIIHLDARCPK